MTSSIGEDEGYGSRRRGFESWFGYSIFRMNGKGYIKASRFGKRYTTKILHGILINRDRLVGEMIDRPPRVRDVAGSIQGRVIPNNLKMVVMDALHWRSGYRVLTLRLTGWCQDKRTSS